MYVLIFRPDVSTITYTSIRIPIPIFIFNFGRIIGRLCRSLYGNYYLLGYFSKIRSWRYDVIESDKGAHRRCGNESKNFVGHCIDDRAHRDKLRNYAGPRPLKSIPTDVKNGMKRTEYILHQ